MPSNERFVKGAGDYTRTFFSRNGKHYRREHQDIGPAIRRVEEIRDLHSFATKASNPGEWRHVGSVPITMILDWLNKNGFTYDQWARNDGGIRGKRYPESRSGVRDKFLAYFLTRDFAKLHNAHITTKRATSQILVPQNYIGSGGNAKLRGTEGSNS
jgi:hypothetical protein